MPGLDRSLQEWSEASQSEKKTTKQIHYVNQNISNKPTLIMQYLQLDLVLLFSLLIHSVL